MEGGVGPRVLVVERDVALLATLEMLLERSHLLPVCANSASEGLHLARSGSLDFALVEFALPDADGLSCVRALLASQPALPVALMTGSGSQQVAFCAGRLGAVAYLEKPFDASLIPQLVRQHLVVVDESCLDNRLVARAERLVEGRFGDPAFSRATAAHLLRITPEHLSRIVKRDTSFTFGELLRRRRLWEARRLVSETNLSMKEIAQHAGFVQPSHMAAAFRQAFGRSATEFRKHGGQGVTR
jgi:AraC-like DNA-binding protein